MPKKRTLRFTLIALLLMVGLYWSLASAEGDAGQGAYPGGRFLVSGSWLKEHLDKSGVLVVDVRTDEHFDNKLIPGAIRLPWSLFRDTDRARGLADVFVGADKAQEILGRHGIARSSEVVLYDSVARDGGATASYLFWVLDLLGHERKMVLERGIDGWLRAGGGVVNKPAELEPILYQAPAEEIEPGRLADGAFVQSRLGDPYYQILDVRSEGEYTGEKANTDLNGRPLKRGHIPQAVNRPYTSNWESEESKDIKTYSQLQELYRGLDPAKAAVTYCHSGRRGSFSYFILRLMGFKDVKLYEASWNEWGNPDLFFPVETAGRSMAGTALPQASPDSSRSGGTAAGKSGRQKGQKQSESGYVSCGG